jgi:hypothetical protein
MKKSFATVVLVIVLGALAGFGGSFANIGHNGKQGPPGITGKVGPTGLTGRSAAVNDLGVCVTVIMDASGNWLDNVWVQTPDIVDGVRQCTNGGNFVSVVPAPAS